MSGRSVPSQLDQVLPRFSVQEPGPYHPFGRIRIEPFGKGVLRILRESGYILAGPYSTAPLVGASGAIAGVVAAYAMIRPCAKVTVVVIRFIVLRVKAFWVVGGWILWQFVQIAMQEPGDQVAYSAHIGGLVVGAVLLLLIKGPDVVLFECLDHEEKAGDVA